MGNKISENKKPADFKNIIDTIATYYILTMDFKNLSKLAEKEECDKMLVLTSDIIGKYFTLQQISFLEDRVQNGEHTDVMTNDKVIYMTKEQLQRKAENITILRETLAKSNLAPRERYAVPMTASQEIGWHASRHTSMAKPLYLATHPKSDVAEFGEQYVVAMGCGPYDKTQINKRERST